MAGRTAAVIFDLDGVLIDSEPVWEEVRRDYVAGQHGLFEVRISTEQVGRGKPAPDVYLEAAARLGVPPAACVAVEDSSNGVRSAAAAGMRVIAAPGERYPLAADAADAAGLVLAGLDELTAAAVEGLP